jgi:phage FluMu protein Com
MSTKLKYHVDARNKVTASCQFTASFELTCPICKAVVPANTPHSCEMFENPPKAKRRRKPAVQSPQSPVDETKKGAQGGQS